MKSSKVDNDTKKSGRLTKSAASEESPPKPRTRTSPSRSPARGRKLSPGPRASRKSPARKSPARKSPARKSPARKSPSRKSPARKSPSRTTVKDEEPPKSPSRRPPIKSETKSVSKVTTNVKIEIPRLSRAPRQTTTDYSFKELKSIDVVNGTDGLRERKPTKVAEDISSKIASRRSIRLKESTDSFEKLLRLAQTTKLPKSDYFFENFSDGENGSEDDSILKKRRSATRTLVTPLHESVQDEPEFGGTISLLCRLVLSPLFIVGLNILCNNSRCSYTALPNLKPYTKLDSWINLKSITIYVSFIFLQASLAIIPYFGRRVSIPGGRYSFVANGIFTLVSTAALLFSLEYLDIPIISTIYSQYFQLLITAVVYGFLGALVLFLLSRHVPDEDRNPFGNTGSALHDFWAGREINPFLFGKLHVKVFILRTALVGASLTNIVSLYQGVNVKNFPILSNVTLQELETYKQVYQSISINPTLLVSASLQIIYFLNGICQESSFIFTFEHQYEGSGLMIMLFFAMYPFTIMSITRYVLENNVTLPYHILAVVLIIFATGLYIFNASNTQKSIFRDNPLNPQVAHLDSLPTFQGKRLLISGWWGFVRHPNYLGDILIHLSWAVGALQAPPALFVLANILFFVHRASRDGKRCSKRYGAAWDRYCQRVPYILIPRVY